MSVQAALDYQLPENTCSKPEIVTGGTNVVAPIQDPSSINVFQGSSTAVVSDIDSYERGRQERKEERWRKCLAKYKEGLLNDFERLRGSAQHGLTEEQAHAILTKMALVQRVYFDPDGILEPEEGYVEDP
jgi:hypothetical protein